MTLHLWPDIVFAGNAVHEYVPCGWFAIHGRFLVEHSFSAGFIKNGQDHFGNHLKIVLRAFVAHKDFSPACAYQEGRLEVAWRSSQGVNRIIPSNRIVVPTT